MGREEWEGKGRAHVSQCKGEGKEEGRRAKERKGTKREAKGSVDACVRACMCVCVHVRVRACAFSSFIRTHSVLMLLLASCLMCMRCGSTKAITLECPRSKRLFPVSLTHTHWRPLPSGHRAVEMSSQSTRPLDGACRGEGRKGNQKQKQKERKRKRMGKKGKGKEREENGKRGRERVGV